MSFFFFKQRTAYGLRISDWSSDVCSSDLVDVNMANGLVRQYSLCNVPGETDRYLIAVLRDPNTRGGSAFMHDRVQQGDTLTISQPRNLFALARDARRSILFAGGIGVTPILAMRSEERRVGKEGGTTCRTRGSLYK